MNLLFSFLLYGIAIVYWFSRVDFDFLPAGLGKIDDVIVVLAAMYFSHKGLPKGFLKSLVLKSGPKATPDAEEIDPYEVLLIPEEAGRDRVMRAYFKQRALYAADRVANMSEEFQNTAEQKLAQIEQAYQMLLSLDRARRHATADRPTTAGRQEDEQHGNGK